MKIIIDNILFHLQKTGGASVYWYELISRLLKSNHEIVFIEQAGGKCDRNIFWQRLALNNILYEKKTPIVLLRYFPVRIHLKADKPFIFHSTHYRVLNNKKALNITTVHDFTYEKYIKGIKKWVHHIQKRHAIKQSAGIICVSNHTKDDLLHYFPWVDESKIKVIYNAVSDKFYKIPDSKQINLETGAEIASLTTMKYILFVGGRSGYKNFNLAVDVISKLPAEYHFVIVGPGLQESEKSMLEKINGRFSHFKEVATEELNILYNFAFCLLYPSSYEGFGIPVIEAMKTGCPVVASNVSSIPEVAGNAGVLVDNISSVGFLSAVLKLENETFRNDIIEKGYLQADKFSWENSYQQLIKFYDDILTQYN
ncbi:MAG TPA: glycosyltransferase family 1 protein [Bacillota bacterium]|nr:glycosyltransferase family 1 protein [Bacillota bacterium]